MTPKKLLTTIALNTKKSLNFMTYKITC